MRQVDDMGKMLRSEGKHTEWDGCISEERWRFVDLRSYGDAGP